MTIFRAVFDVCATIVSPFLFPSLDTAKFGADVATLRDASEKCLIPADQIRGVMRHAWEELYHEVSDNNDALLSPHGIFGHKSGSDAAKTDAPDRGTIIFSDLAAETGTPTMSHRISIDEDTGAVKRGALVVLELAAPIGQSVIFQGTVVFFGTEKEIDQVQIALNAAASRVSAIGSAKSAGFGEVQKLELSLKSKEAHHATPVTPSFVTPDDTRIQFRLEIDKPFLVNSDKEADNVFVGDPIIPGAAIKGALARAMLLSGEDPSADTAFAALKVSHAHPNNWKSRAIPLSVVANKDTAADSLGQNSLAPASAEALLNYQGDWKDQWAINDKIQIPNGQELRRETRAHVKISDVGQVAEEAQLFFTSAICPDDRWWNITVDFQNVPKDDRPRLYGWLLRGSDWLGSTQARFTLESCPQSASKSVKNFAHGHVAITLETDALLIPMTRDTRAAYKAYWQNLLGGELVDFCAKEAMRGGWMGMHYREDTTRYQPFHVTCAGSVFLMAGSDEKKIEKFLRENLPTPLGTNWSNCPFQPENGYGEIRADWQGVPNGGTAQ